MSEANPVLKLENITKEFFQGNRQIEVLSGLELSIEKGELVAIIGESGSGKSTLLQIAGLLDKPTSGSIILSNHNANTAGSNTQSKLRLKELGFIYQFHHLLGDFTARENIIMPGVLLGRNKEECFEEADILLKKLKIFERRFNMPSQLSGGEQQRVAIARAMFNKPSLILADEPTGNLDPHTGEQVFEMLSQLCKEQNTSALIVTHNHQLAYKADRVFKLEQGKLLLQSK